MKLLLGTTNLEKINILKSALQSLSLEILTLNELGINVTVEENGVNSEENARIKAIRYYEESDIPTLTTDASLYIKGFPPDKQPNSCIRRILSNKSTISDVELLEYYSKEIKKIGNQTTCLWKVSLVLLLNFDNIFSKSYSFETILTSKKSRILNPGAPLNSLMMDIKSHKYYSEISPNERPDYKIIQNFVRSHLLS